ncbi:MAG: tryptophan-rich sensory protein [Bacteroidetes bacterium]|nr:tryptophan-rich sensory protein [Bacteroidota bacterium]
MKQFVKSLFLFLLLNFGALSLGGFLMGSSPAENTWYLSQNKAPWTPPGWVFGFAWTLIMLLFSVYMSLIWRKNPGKQNALIYGIHLLLNISWNGVFFQFHLVSAGFVILLALLIVLLLTQKKNFGWLNWSLLLILPYCVWLCIASSLNLFVLLYN